MSGKASARCGSCRHFRNDAAYLETAIPGLSSMSSADASARGDDGLCLHHDRYLSARASCADFTPTLRDPPAVSQARRPA
jgi:hypothetical protein